MNPITIHYDTVSSPVGNLFIGATDNGICTVMILSKHHHIQTEYDALMGHRINSVLSHNPSIIAPYADALLNYIKNGDTISHLPLDIYGTDFQKNVWEKLLQIPYGNTCTYTHIANQINNPNAVRAVGTAIGKNPISIIIPCHRVLNKSGNKNNYLWGVNIKNQLLSIEQSNC